MRALLIFLSITAMGLVAMAKEHKVLQIGKSFTKPLSDKEIEALKNSRGKFIRTEVNKNMLREIKVKKGDTVNFINKDNVEHNVFGKGFDFHQTKGSENRISFDDVGTRTIRCAIHPKMKLKVVVE